MASTRLHTGTNAPNYMENQGALYGLIDWRPVGRPDLNHICMIAQMRTSLPACNAWFYYVPFAANMADLPTRLDAEALLRLEQLGPRVPLLLPPARCLAKLQGRPRTSPCPPLCCRGVT